MSTTDTQAEQTMSDGSGRPAPEIQVFRVYIEAPQQKVWDAITSPEFDQVRLRRRGRL